MRLTAAPVWISRTREGASATGTGWAPPPGGTPLYKPYKYVPRQWVGFLRLFGLKTGIDFAHFGLESGMVFEETTWVYQGIYRFNSKLVRKKEKYANSKWMNSFFVCPLI